MSKKKKPVPLTVEAVIDHLEGTLLDDIDSMTEEKRCLFWSNVMEFKQSKRQRTTYRQSDDIDTNFTVTIINTKEEADAATRNPDILQDAPK